MCSEVESSRSSSPIGQASGRLLTSGNKFRDEPACPWGAQLAHGEHSCNELSSQGMKVNGFPISLGNAHVMRSTWYLQWLLGKWLLQFEYGLSFKGFSIGRWVLRVAELLGWQNLEIKVYREVVKFLVLSQSHERDCTASQKDLVAVTLLCYK